MPYSKKRITFDPPPTKPPSEEERMRRAYYRRGLPEPPPAPKYHDRSFPEQAGGIPAAWAEQATEEKENKPSLRQYMHDKLNLALGLRTGPFKHR